MLVRPDGHVAWRGDSEPANTLAMIDTVRRAGPRIAARRARDDGYKARQQDDAAKRLVAGQID